MTAVLPSPLSGITGDVTFVRAISENGIIHDAILRDETGQTQLPQRTLSERSRPRPLPTPQEQQNYPCPRG